MTSSIGDAHPRDPRRPQAAAGELRPVSVLSCALQLRALASGGLSAEAHGVAAGRFRRLVCDVVERFGGVAGSLVGRRATSFFGVPTSGEDTAARAARAALELQRRVAEESAALETRGSIAWSTGIGLTTGQAMIDDGLVSGAVVDAAPSLAEVAEPGEILASPDVVRRLMGRYRFDAEAVDRADPAMAPALRAHRLIGPEASAPDVDGPMVGRAQELALLEALAERSFHGRGQIVAVTGEAGIGKTRLLAALHESLADTDHLHVALRGRPHDDAPFGPWTAMIRRAAQLEAADAPEVVAHKLEQYRATRGVERLPRALLTRLTGAAEMAGDGDIARCADALARWVHAASQRKPVRLEIEDLQWLDAGTLAFVKRLIEDRGHAPVMLLVTLRTDETPALDALRGRPGISQIALSPLTEAESQALAAAIERDGDHDGDRDDAIQTTVARAEGNPYILRALLRHAAAEGDGEIPESIQERMMARLDALSHAARRLLQIAAVLGPAFGAERLETAWPGPEPVAHPLAELRRRGLLLRAAADASQLSFGHRLLHQAVYDSLLPGRRRHLHAEIAAVLDVEETERTEDELGQRADHRRAAGRIDASLDDRIRLAEKAAARGAHDRAAEALQEALADADRLPADRRAARVDAIAMPLVEALFSAGRMRPILALFDARPAVFENAENPSRVGRYEAWRALTLSYAGRGTDAVRAAKKANALGRRVRDEAVQGRGRVVLGLEAFAAGDFKKGKEHGEKALILLERADDLWWQAQALEVRAACDLVGGEIDAALDSLEAAEALRSAIGDWRLCGQWIRIYALGVLDDERPSRAAEAQETAERRCVDAASRSLLAGARGVAHGRAGRFEDAAAALTQAVEDLGDLGMRRFAGWFGAWLARVRVLAGDAAAGRVALSDAEARLQDAGFALGDGELARARAALAQSDGDAAQARAHLDEAQGVWARFGVRIEQASEADASGR
ncbi:MAG: AAA family ATPase [Acidobacteriota bacterium]